MPTEQFMPLQYSTTPLICGRTVGAGLRHTFCVAEQRSDKGAANLIQRRITYMLWTILAVILVLWMLGMVGSVGGSLIHLLLVVAAVVLVIQLLSGRRPIV